MITIQIKDARLEQRLATQAQQQGKSAQELATELLLEALTTESREPLNYEKRNPLEFGTVISFEATDSDEVRNTMPFKTVTDTVEYAKEIRKKAWR